MASDDCHVFTHRIRAIMGGLDEEETATKVAVRETRVSVARIIMMFFAHTPRTRAHTIHPNVRSAGS